MIVSPNVLPTVGDVRIYIILQTWQLIPDLPVQVFIRFNSNDDGDDEDANTKPMETRFFKVLNPFNVVIRSPPGPKGVAVVTVSQNDRAESAKVLYESPTDRLAKTIEAAVDPLELVAESLGISPSTTAEVDRQLSGRIDGGGKRGGHNFGCDISDKPPTPKQQQQHNHQQQL